MSAIILDGKAIAQNIKDQLKQEIAQLNATYGRVPRLVNVMVGKDPGSCAYAASQQRTAQYIGIDYALKTLPSGISQDDFVNVIGLLNKDADVHGIMIHKPLPEQIRYRDVANVVDTNKDVEGINVTNIGKMIIGETAILPCTPASVMALIKASGVPVRGKEAVIIGHSDIVGKPLSLLLLRELATVTVCHIATSEAGKLQEHIARADILVVAVGKKELVKGAWIKPGALVIDVGINAIGNKIVGDVEFDAARAKAGHISPVPGGVGPVTVVMLMRNGVEAFKLQLEEKENRNV